MVRHLRDQGWLCASLRHYGGAGDTLAIKPGHRARIIETKAVKEGTLWSAFRKQDRVELLKLAAEHDADPLVAWTPSPTQPIRWLLGPGDWPSCGN